jgi:hypothetical protein
VTFTRPLSHSTHLIIARFGHLVSRSRSTYSRIFSSSYFPRRSWLLEGRRCGDAHNIVVQVAVVAADAVDVVFAISASECKIFKRARTTAERCIELNLQSARLRLRSIEKCAAQGVRSRRG